MRVLEQNLGDVMDLDDSGTGADQTDIGSTSGVASENADVNADASSSTNVGTSSNANGSANNAAPSGAHAVEHDRASRRDDGGLFVANHGEAYPSGHQTTNFVQPDQPIASTERDLEEDDSTIGLLSRELGDMSLGRGLGTLEMFYKGYFGKYYGVYRYGHDDGPRYSVHYVGASSPRDVSLSFTSKSTLKGTATGKDLPMFQIRGVAWKDAEDCGRMDSLSEDNWASAVRLMFIKVRWGSKDGPDTWERLRAFKDYAYPGTKNKRVAAKREYAYKGIILLRQGAKRHPAELLALDKAVKWELWADDVAANEGNRPADRSSPGAVEQPEVRVSAQAAEEEEL